MYHCRYVYKGTCRPNYKVVIIMFQPELELKTNVDFIIQLSVILIFSTMLIGIVIKKFMQMILKG